MLDRLDTEAKKSKAKILNVALVVFGSSLVGELATRLAKPMIPAAVPSQAVDEPPWMLGTGLRLFTGPLISQKTSVPSVPPAQMVRECSADD